MRLGPLGVARWLRLSVFLAKAFSLQSRKNFSSFRSPHQQELTLASRCLFLPWCPMKIHWLKIHCLLLSVLPCVSLHAFQHSTPQGALEELASTTKPEVLASHLPEPVQKSIDALPKL